jgi:hypothetical protein
MAWENSVLVASGPGDAALAVSGTPPNAKPVAPASSSTTIDGQPWGTGWTIGTTRVALFNQGGSPGVAAITNGVWIYEGYNTAMSRPASPDPYSHGNALDNETVIRVATGTALAHTEHAMITQGAITVDTTSIAHSRQILRVNVRDWGATGAGGTTDDSLAIHNAYNSITSGIVSFPAGTYFVGSGATLTFPAGVQVEFEEGASLSTSSHAITINGRVLAHPLQRIFAISGTGSVTLTSTSIDAYPCKWWGLVGDGMTDDSANLAAAISSITTPGGTLVFPPSTGNYKIAAAVTVPSNVQLSFKQGAVLAPSGVQVTINGGIIARATGSRSTLPATSSWSATSARPSTSAPGR